MNKLTPEYLESLIIRENTMYVRDSFAPANDSTMTIVILKLKNGFEVIGQSSCVDPVNFDKEIGTKIARDNAVNKLWELEGYLLKQRIYEAKDV